MKDWIVSYRDKERYALITYEKIDKFDHYYEGVIIESDFPKEVVFLINECNSIIDEMAISLLDEIEKELYSYDIRLEKNRSKIFDIQFTDESKISFFTKYPSSRGYLDKYPSS